MSDAKRIPPGSPGYAFQRAYDRLRAAEARADAESARADAAEKVASVEARAADRARAERDAERERAERLAAAGQWLLRLKDGPRDADYEREKPEAWQALREALASSRAIEHSDDCAIWVPDPFYEDSWELGDESLCNCDRHRAAQGEGT